MTHFQWRRFMFFDIEKDVDKGALLEALSDSAEVTVVSGGRGLLAIGDTLGRLHLFDRRMSPKTLNVFSGMSLKLVSRASTKSGLIVCVSGNSNDNLVKIYDIDKPDKNNSGMPSLVRSTR